MNGQLNAKHDHGLATEPAASAQVHARVAGVLYLLTIVAGFVGEVYVPSKLIVPGDATLTARNVTGSTRCFVSASRAISRKQCAMSHWPWSSTYC
jgi:hypothetical protein